MRAAVGLLLIGLLSACTPPSGPEPSSASTGSPSAGTTTARAVPTPGVEGVGASPYDETTAPAAFRTRTPLPSCGATRDAHASFPERPTAHQHADDAVVACWLSAHAAGRPAEARVVLQTVDSGPAFGYVRTVGGEIEVWASLKDRMSGPNAPITWSHWRCQAVEPRNLAPTDCATISN